ncbi:polysaccharide pyruvyl transferase family protein [Sphingosinicellaceae bacterium]|nr:polysaccharide pyruvyl transferase family protein [Sphingosinicellaceae bacterium]
MPDYHAAPNAADQEIVLVTRLHTKNQGNQALSVVWRDLLGSCFPTHAVRPIERSPAYLKRFRVGRFASVADPVAAFDAVARGLVAELPAGARERPPIDPAIRHDTRMGQTVRFRALRQALALRSRLSTLGLAKTAYLERLALFQGAALVVVNPAGEFMAEATDTPIGYLLDIRCAQLLGIPTAVVNLSFEVTDPTVRRLSAHVFDHCDLVELRDKESQHEYAAAGGSGVPVVLPDAALLTKPPSNPGFRATKGSVALAINGMQLHDARLEPEWEAFLERLLDRGVTPTLTSNEWSTDAPLWAPVLARQKITAVGQNKDYRAYMEMLGGFEIVVSSRLHSCVLAMLAGAVVVPLELGTFKLTGFFKEAGFSDLPIRLGSPGWEDAVLARIATIQADPEAARAAQSTRRDAARRALHENLSDALRRLEIAPIPAARAA